MSIWQSLHRIAAKFQHFPIDSVRMRVPNMLLAPQVISEELLDDARFAVLVIGSLEIVLAILRLSVLGVVLGVATLAASRVPRIYEWLRFVAAGSVCVWLLLTPNGVEAVALLLPLAFVLPSQALVPCVAAAIVFRTDWPIPVIAAAAAVVAWLHERRRVEREQGHIALIQSTQELRVEQARALAAEHGASLERFAAAISHELNTPVGAIRSSVQTLRAISGKFVSASEAERRRVASIHNELTNLLLNSAERVQGIVARLQRLTSLDRALVRPTDVNGILRDVAATVEAEVSGGASIRLNLHSIPLVTCETQAWTTILTRLISAAASRPDQRLIDISTELANDHIVIDIVEVGRDAAASIDPSFTNQGGRIGTTNWTQFQVRSWIQQHGGNLRQFSDSSRGLTTRVSIPVTT